MTAKYIRVGREPGYMKDCFFLDKILVYDKEIKGKRDSSSFSAVALRNMV